MRTFEQWVNHIFDHPVTEHEWFWGEDVDKGVESAAINVAYLTRLFTECDPVLRKFDNAQVDQGLNMIAFPACSDHAYTITSSDVPWPARQAAIRSIFQLYSKCFSARCSAGLGHLDKLTNPLNTVCYMWWDIFPGRMDSIDRIPLNEASECIDVMERTLKIPHIACQEGALHGLSHWSFYSPKRVESIVEEFLKYAAESRRELLEYALRAIDR